MKRGYKCGRKKQINKELLDNSVSEIIIKLVSNPNFAPMMQEKINYEKRLRQAYKVRSKLIKETASLDTDDRHCINRKADLDNRLYK
ncbi:MAG: hypothetical protein MSJ26_03960 [Oscillospiraceae bacterium]|nr:hypothetical protein [Oscillospiraceae bacterium]